ncbi:hypothetical protein FSW04_19015 [Baekduia soli]|uniref:MarR family transcriptional regulator n=1 Tax=Baekduia soli TaxID=496014 RepID=A0A5B8U9V7_9ACTN|nr:hypothetical protein [Baekduia soli]QEC49452.1 hypothetical protein FSW04_19015 [Baekduia soli]
MQATGVSAKQLTDELMAFLTTTIKSAQGEVFRLVGELDLSMTQLKMLFALDAAEQELTPSELATAVGLSPRPPAGRSTRSPARASCPGARTTPTGASSAWP